MNININSLEADAALALDPLHIPGSTKTVQPPKYADLGVRLSLYSAPQGLAIVIDPLTMLAKSKNGVLGGVLEAFDTATVWLNGVATGASDTVMPGKEGERMLVYLAPGLLRDGINKMFYQVERLSGNYEDSPTLDVLYYTPASGVTVSHPSSVGPGQTGPITITLSYPRPYGTVTLTIGTWSTTFNNFDHTKPIIYPLTAADLQLIGDGTHLVSAIHSDQLTNSNVSPTTSIVITANTLVLLPPSVTGQAGNNFNPTLQNVEGVVPAGTLQPTDKVHVEWKGAISTPAASFTSPQRLVSAGLKFVVPRSVLAYSLGKVVKVTYVIERNGVSTSSQDLPLNILPLPATALISPKILEADANNVLDVTALGTQNATIHALLFTLIADGMPCWLSLEGKKPDGTAHNLVLWNGLPARVNPTWVSQGFWPYALVNSYLKQLGDGTSLIIKFAVSMDMSNVRATAVEFPDRMYTVKSLVLVVPTLKDVLDTGNQQVVEGGVTISTMLKLKGKASIGQQVEIFDGNGPSAVSKGKATANTAGDWELPITVAAGARRLYARSLYHPGNPVYSNVRNLTVVSNIVPQIQLITDSNKVTIPNNGSTVSTSIIVSGIATPSTKINLVNGGAPIPGLPEILVDPKGEWSQTMTNLVPGKTYNLRAKRKDGPVSGAYNVVVVDIVNPTIKSVTTVPDGVEIPHNGSTTATSINVTGAASVMQSIEILVNGQSKATLTTKADGSFSQILSGFIFDVRTDIQVRALYANNPVSSIRSFVVHRPLQIDVQQMTLHGLTVKTTAFAVLRDSPGNTETRVASNGVKPYKYRSLNPNVASVDANGKTIGISNGDTRIESTDGAGQVLSYPVSVKGVYRLAINNAQQDFPTALNWMSQVRGSPVTAVALNNIILIYGQWMPISLNYWLCDPQAGHATGRTFFHHEYRGVYLADPRAAYLGAWCLIST